MPLLQTRVPSWLCLPLYWGWLLAAPAVCLATCGLKVVHWHGGQIGGIPTCEVNALEVELLGLLDYRMFVTRHELWLQLKAIRAKWPLAPLPACHCKLAAKQDVAAVYVRARKAPAAESFLVPALQC